MASSLAPPAHQLLQERDSLASLVVRPTASTEGILRPQEAHRHIDLRRYPPTPEVGCFVERYWAVHWDLRDRPPYQVELLPHPCVNVTFTRAAGAQAHGVGTRRSAFPLTGAGAVFGVKFRPGGFAAFTGVGASSLTDRSVPLREVFGAAADDLHAAVLAAGSDEHRVRLLDMFLASITLRSPAEAGYRLVVEIIARMLGDRTITRVDQVARQQCLSVRTVQRLFHRYVGVGPKWVIRRYRMHDGAARLAGGTVTDPAALAVELGWFDQAHFTRDFTGLLGMSPLEYAAACVGGHGGPDPG